MSWTKEETARLKRLARTDMFFSEIAKELGKTPGAVRHRAHRIEVSRKVNGRMGKWNSKHSHLREGVFRYFLNHTWEETREHFHLKDRELKSVFTVGYRDPKLRHLRKDGRRHDAWSLDETLFMLRSSGLQPRDWIAKKLKRGTMQSVKEALDRNRAQSRYINGMPIGWALTLFGDSAIGMGIKTKAGPTGTGPAGFQFRLIPWVEVERLIKGKSVHPEVRAGIEAMAKFQRWLHGVKSERAIRVRIENTIRGKT